MHPLSDEDAQEWGCNEKKKEDHYERTSIDAGWRHFILVFSFVIAVFKIQNSHNRKNWILFAYIEFCFLWECDAFFRVLLFVTALLFPICKPESKRIPSKDEKCGQHSYDLWSLLLETYRSAFFLISLFLTVNLCSFVFSMISYSLPPFRRLAFSFFC